MFLTPFGKNEFQSLLIYAIFTVYFGTWTFNDDLNTKVRRIRMLTWFRMEIRVRRRRKPSRILSKLLVSNSLLFVLFLSDSLWIRSLFSSLSPKPFVIARNSSLYEFLLELWRWRFNDDDFQGKSLRTFCKFEPLLLNWTHFVFDILELWIDFCMLNDEFDEEFVWILSLWWWFEMIEFCYGGGSGGGKFVTVAGEKIVSRVCWVGNWWMGLCWVGLYL
jgi:hypothetical protein